MHDRIGTGEPVDSLSDFIEQKQKLKKMEVWLYVFLTGNSVNAMETEQKEL